MQCPFRAHALRGEGRESVTTNKFLAALFCAGALCCSVHAGPDWTEPPAFDAGSDPASAQVPSGPAGPLRTIAGSTSAAFTAAQGVDFEDVYRIRICDPVRFCLRVSATFDSQIWLFDGNGLGILGNDQANGDDAVVYPPANDSTQAKPAPTTGTFLIAISGFDNDPLSLLPGVGPSPIFNQQRREERSGPDGEGGQFPLTEWSGSGEVGQYLIRLEGATFADQDCSNGPYVFNPCVPALSDWGLAALVLALLCTATVVISRKRAA